MESRAFYERADVEHIRVADATVALRRFGHGEPVVFIHGFPTSGYTWRHLLPRLSERFQCLTLDLPGLGDSAWTDRTDFSSDAQNDHVLKVLNAEGIGTFSLVAHDSGATAARILAIRHPDRVKNLVIFNTEIPFHGPPWIPFYQKAGLLPLVPDILRFLLKQDWFVKSPMGFKEAYTDRSMLDHPDNIRFYIECKLPYKPQH